jgi:hypothetical protein
VPAFDSAPIVEARKGGEANRTINGLQDPTGGPGETDVRASGRQSTPESRLYSRMDNYLVLEFTMSKSKLEKARTLPRSLYRWSFVVLLPLLALVLSACGTGGSSGGIGY